MAAPADSGRGVLAEGGGSGARDLGLITEYYRQQNRELHENIPMYGARERHAQYREIEALAKGSPILDYGCGKAVMSRHLPNVTNYDPALYPELPESHEVVVCMDVLEHVEPECLQAVLEHIASLTGRVAYIVVCRKRGTKKLPDGRHAHLIVKPAAWWQENLSGVFGRVEQGESPASRPYDITFRCYP